MEISEDVYRKFSWNPTVVTKPKDDIFSTEPIVDVTAMAFDEMERQRRANRDAYQRQYQKILKRYDNQETYCRPDSRWMNYTPKQLKRMKKQTNKWRKRLVGEFY